MQRGADGLLKGVLVRNFLAQFCQSTKGVDKFAFRLHAIGSRRAW